MSQESHKGGCRLNRSTALIAIALIGAAGGAESVCAQEVGFTVAPYLWVTSASANVTLGRTSTEVHKSFLDLIRESESAFAFSGYGAVHYGKWSFFLEGLYSRLTADTNVGPLPTNTRSVTSLLDFGLSYRMDVYGVPGSGGWATTLEPYVGGRYVNLSARIKGGVSGPVGNPLGIDVSKSFSGVDPIFGARLTTEIDSRWRVTFAGDVGGGAATKVTWSASGLVGYRFEMSGIYSTLWLGYRALGMNFDTGGTVPFRMNQVLHGPIIGSSFRF